MENKNRKVEDSIEAFYAKCAKLNIPPSVMPDHQFLKRILRGYMSPFECFNNRVDSKQDIERIRNVILAHEMKDIKKSTIKNSSALPHKLQLYLEYKKCCERINACDNQLTTIKQKEQEVLERLKTNEVKKITAEKELSAKRSRVDVLQALSNKLNDDIKSEEVVAEKILSTQQILNVPNVLEEATARVNKTVEVLNEFSSKGVFSTNAKENCMKEVEKNIYNVPNTLIFEILTNMLKSRAEDPIFDSEEGVKRLSIQEEMLNKFQELKIRLGFQLIASKRNVEDLKQACAAKIQQVESQLETILDNAPMYYDDDEDGDIVGEFVSMLFAKLIQEGKMKVLTEKIQPYKDQSEGSGKYFEKLMQNIQDSNEMITDKVAAIQSSVAQAHLINEKSKFANMKLMRTVNNLKLEKHQQINRTMLNQTVTGFEKSFEIGLLNSELKLFLASPMNNEEMIDLNLEQLFSATPLTQLFAQNYPLFIKSLKTLNELMQSAQKCTMEISQSQVNILSAQFLESLEKNRDQNRTEINEVFDNITKMNVTIKSLFGNIHQIIKYIQDNPLRKFIDPKQKYENKTYLDYEKEYMLYYKMIKQ